MTSNTLDLEYLDVFREDSGVEELVYYTVPTVKLAGAVNAELTKVGVRSGGGGSHTVVIQLSKQRSFFWKHPALDASNKPVKLHWLKLAVRWVLLPLQIRSKMSIVKTVR